MTCATTRTQRPAHDPCADETAGVPAPALAPAVAPYSDVIEPRLRAALIRRDLDIRVSWRDSVCGGYWLILRGESFFPCGNATYARRLYRALCDQMLSPAPCGDSA